MPTSEGGAAFRPLLAVYGDSIAVGWGLAAEEALPARLAGEFARLGRDVDVRNFGASGEAAPAGLLRLPAVLAARPDLVLLEFGANDCYDGVPVEATRDALEAMIKGLLGAGAKIFLAGWRTRSDLFKPEFDNPDLSALVPIAPPLFNAEYVGRFNSVHAGLAAEYHLPFLPHILDPLLDPDLEDMFQADGIHPNAAGARRLAAALAPLLLPLLPSARP